MRKHLGFLLVALLVVVAQPALAAKAPDFSLPGDHGTVRLSAHRGTPVYLDFWASWCGPCRRSFPWMNAMKQRYGDGLTILAVNLDKNRSLARKFIRTMKPAFTIAYDPKGDIAEAYGVKGMPSSYIIDAKGRIVSSHVGFRKKDEADMEATISRLVGGRTGR
ncbi:MAG TPA: TlpA disulfide reductase family protein [Gammaproteobacteria bacterium]|nr:TlpA disulfide reductase family protein [Gammaproteobacteria bacterium]